MRGASKLPNIAQIFDSSRNTAFEPASVSCKVVLICVANKFIARHCSRTSTRCKNIKWTVATPPKWSFNRYCSQIHFCLKIVYIFWKGLSINDFTALGRGGIQGFCDDSTKRVIIKNVTMGGIRRGCQKLIKIAWRHLWITPYLTFDVCLILFFINSNSLNFFKLLSVEKNCISESVLT